MLPPHEEMVRKLVAIPSVSSSDERFDQSNRAVVELLADWAAGLGFEVLIEAIPRAEGKVNLIATLGEGAEGLVLSGHTDTVPYNEERWTDDPFKLTERDGRHYGLGSADMKGFFAAALHAVARIDPARLNQRITLLGTADEESTMAGAAMLADRGESLGRYAIIGEPTGLRPIRKHKGVFQLRITVGGRAGHASHPALGVSAIDGLSRVLAGLRAWNERLGRKHRDDDFEVATPTLNFGRVSGGDSPNRICDAVTLDVDMRLLPEMSADAVQQQFTEQVAEALDGGAWSFDVQRLGYHDAFGGPEDAEFSALVEGMCGCSAQTAMFGTEAPYLAELGLQTLVLGAGDIRVAHQPDEYVTMAEIERATEIYGQLIDRYCLSAR